MESVDTFSTLRAAGTAAIADIFDTLSLAPPVLDNALRPVGRSTVFAGPAYTVIGEPRKFTGGDRLKLESIDNMQPGVVAIWASQDAKGVCCFGDLLATAMRSRGIAAAVVDGGVRDARFLADFGMPVVSRYLTPAQGVGRWKVTAYQTSAQVRGALSEWLTIAPGDIIVGDEDGIIAIPANLLETITTAVAKLSTTESAARAEIAQGMPLLAAIAKYGAL